MVKGLKGQRVKDSHQLTKITEARTLDNQSFTLFVFLVKTYFQKKYIFQKHGSVSCVLQHSLQI